MGEEADPHERGEVRRRRRRIAGPLLGALAAALALSVPATAQAQEASRTDPEVGSPAETVYGIPLEEARRDAAPDALPGSAVRSDRGVGSSVRVPGREEPPTDDGELDPEAAAERRQRLRRAARAAERVSGNPSPAATTTMLVLIVGIAAVGGAGAARLVGSRYRI